MKLILIALASLLATSLSITAAHADEECQIKLGFKNFFIYSENGGLANADASKFGLAYWEHNQLKKVSDAQITLLQIMPFHHETYRAPMGAFTQVDDYAMRVEVKTTTTEIYPRMMGNPAIKKLIVSTLCTSIVSSEGGPGPHPVP